jgi:hypothetical protein
MLIPIYDLRGQCYNPLFTDAKIGHSKTLSKDSQLIMVMGFQFMTQLAISQETACFSHESAGSFQLTSWPPAAIQKNF